MTIFTIELSPSRGLESARHIASIIMIIKMKISKYLLSLIFLQFIRNLFYGENKKKAFPYNCSIYFFFDSVIDFVNSDSSSLRFLSSFSSFIGVISSTIKFEERIFN